MGVSIPTKSGSEVLAGWAHTKSFSVLPDKFAKFLFEFHGHRCERLDLSVLLADRSIFYVHGALLDDKVHEYVTL